MLPLSALLLFLLSGSAPRAAPPLRTRPTSALRANKHLHPGKYRLTVAGVLCNACTRAIVEQVQAIPDIKEARFDFEEGYLWVTVAKTRKVRLTEIERALRMAARRIELGVDFDLTDIQYVP